MATRRRFTAPAFLTAATAIGAVLAAAALALEFGFRDAILSIWILHFVQLAAIGLYVGHLLHQLAASQNRAALLRHRAVDWLVIVAGLTAWSVSHDSTPRWLLATAAFYVVVMQALRAARYGWGAAGDQLLNSQRRLKPGRIMLLSFSAAILAGTLLLALPRATTQELAHTAAGPIAEHLLGSFFTATSATCVTGLVLYDTGTHYTRFGQVVILVLIQLGGLGIMVFGSVFGLLTRRQLSLRESLALQDTVSHQVLGELRHVVLFMVATTVLCEAVGAVMLYGLWSSEITQPGDRLFYSVFHAVSAFCNAGFALDSASLQPWRGQWQIYTAIMPLIVIGGVGFPVIYEVYGWARHRIKLTKSRWGRPRDMRHAAAPYRFSLHTKLVSAATIALIVIPAAMIFCFESWPAAGVVDRASSAALSNAGAHEIAMADLDVTDRALAALFQSVTCRTAGFNTVPMDTESMSTASHFLMSLLMFIGGAPASTAGGVKITALTILLLGVYSTLRGRRHVESCGRSIPDLLVRRAGVLILVMGAAVSAVTLALLLTEHGASLQEVWFESVSACGTVGLSTGLTPQLTVPGRIIIMAAMFVGRLGPLSLLIALAGDPAPGRYQYPQEQVIIG